MKWGAWKANLRWWDVVGVAPLIAAPGLYMFMVFGVLGPLVAIAPPTGDSLDVLRGLLRFVFGATAGLMTFGLVWSFVIAPWFSSGDARFSESSTPAVRGKTYKFLAWAPCMFAAGIPLVLLVESIVDWFLSNTWEPWGLLSPWLVPIIGILALHGWRFNRSLQRRIRASAQRARVCFNCGYRLAEIPHCKRCPECGTEVST